MQIIKKTVKIYITKSQLFYVCLFVAKVAELDGMLNPI